MQPVSQLPHLALPILWSDLSFDYARVPRRSAVKIGEIHYLCQPCNLRILRQQLLKRSVFSWPYDRHSGLTGIGSTGILGWRADFRWQYISGFHEPLRYTKNLYPRLLGHYEILCRPCLCLRYRLISNLLLLTPILAVEFPPLFDQKWPIFRTCNLSERNIELINKISAVLPAIAQAFWVEIMRIFPLHYESWELGIQMGPCCDVGIS